MQSIDEGKQMISIDEVNDILDEIAESLPPEFYKELNGGILLLPDEKISPYAVGNDLWILGEYTRNNLSGRYITIYYGSFMKLFGGLDRDALAEKLRETLVHEFTHHLESLAGERGLEVWDEEQLRDYLDRKK
jgi:Uncharacterized protein conserved in bacteria